MPEARLSNLILRNLSRDTAHLSHDDKLGFRFPGTAFRAGTKKRFRPSQSGIAHASEWRFCCVSTLTAHHPSSTWPARSTAPTARSVAFRYPCQRQEAGKAPESRGSHQDCHSPLSGLRLEEDRLQARGGSRNGDSRCSNCPLSGSRNLAENWNPSSSFFALTCLRAGSFP